MQVDSGAREILNALHEAGHVAYLVGGCVRDFLMGKTPKDWDIATDATPMRIEDLFEKTVPVGKAFGVMLVVRDGREYEVATFRAETGYADGRRPDAVRFSTAEEDVKRRDFTVNALLYDIEEEKVIDYVGGRADIDDRLLRTVGAPRERFLEDHLRLLRAVRFAARTGFAIETQTLAAMREMAALAVTVSAERRGDELTRMFGEGYAAPSLHRLAETGLLRHALPEVARLQGVPQPEAFHPEGDVYTHTRIMTEMLDETIAASLQAEGEGGRERYLRDDEFGRLVFPDPKERQILAWAVLLHDTGKPETITYSDRIRFNRHDEAGAAMAEEILRRLKRPAALCETVRDIIGRHMHFAMLERMREAKRRRFLQDPLFPLHLELHRLDCQSSHRMLHNYHYGLRAWLQEQEREPPPAPLLSGRDLIEMGYRPGPNMGEILEAVEDGQLEGSLKSPEEARAFVEREFPIEEQ